MARRKKTETDIPVSALELDIPQTDAPIEVAEESEEAASVLSESVAQQEPVTPHEAPPSNVHKDIGLWEAIYWRGRPMWRHKRAGTTLSKESLVWKQRNLK